MAAIRSVLVGTCAAAATAAVQLLLSLCSASPPALLRKLLDADLCEYLYECLRSTVPSLVGWASLSAVSHGATASATLSALRALAHFDGTQSMNLKDSERPMLY